MRKIFLTALFIGGLAMFSSAEAQVKKIQRKNLPPAVEKAVVRESKDATIKGFFTETEKGKVSYGAELTVNGQGKAILMDAGGNILEVEDEVSINSLSDEVKSALTKAAKTGTIDKVVTLTKKGKLVAYEAGVVTGKKHSEIQVGPNGKKLSHPE